MNKDPELQNIQAAASAFHEPLHELFKQLEASKIPYVLNPVIPAEWAGRRTLTVLVAPEDVTSAIQTVTASEPHQSRKARLRHFSYEHLTSEKMRNVSKLFHDLALFILDETAPGAEQASALRKLLEGKDAAVRAALEMESEIF